MTSPARKSPPRLAYVVKYYHPMPRISGIITFTRDLMAELARHWEIRVITSRYGPQAPPRESCDGYEIVRLEGPFPSRAGREVRRAGVDLIVFGSGFWRPWYLQPYWELFRAQLGRQAPPVVLTQYTSMSDRARFLLKFLCPRPAAVVTLTAEEKAAWRRIFPGKIAFIPPGVGPASKSPPPEDFIPPAPGRIRIGYFGHLQPHKGPDRILRLVREMKERPVELLLHGEGEMEPQLRELAAGDERIIFQGYVPNPEPWIRSCRLVVLPYRSAVSVLGYSRAALEALAAGVPLLTTPTPAVAPLVEDGVNGYVCRNDKELRGRLNELIENPARLERLGEGARSSARDYEIARVAGEYLSLFRDIRGKE